MKYQTTADWMADSEFVPAHLAKWCERRGGIDAPTRGQMLSTYRASPDYYDSLGGWPAVLEHVERARE